MSSSEHTTGTASRSEGVPAEPGRAADGLQRPLCARFRQQLTPGVDMICIATSCAKRASNTRLLAQALSKSSDPMICAECKS
jgi:hypothetical protein